MNLIELPFLATASSVNTNSYDLSSWDFMANDPLLLTVIFFLKMKRILPFVQWWEFVLVVWGHTILDWLLDFWHAFWILLIGKVPIQPNHKNQHDQNYDLCQPEYFLICFLSLFPLIFRIRILLRSHFLIFGLPWLYLFFSLVYFLFKK